MNRLLLVAFSLLSLSCASTEGAPDSIHRDPVYRETEIRQARPRIDGEIFDAQENSPDLISVFSNVDRESERAVANVHRDDQFIFLFWETKKQILQEKYAIDWRSPAELNPNIGYDRYGQPRITEDESACIVSFIQEHLVGTSEEVVGAWRTFEGIVFLATRDPNSGVVRHYELNGHDQSWIFVNVYVFTG